MLSRAIWALFLNILVKIWLKQNIVDPILGGALLLRPLRSATEGTKIISTKILQNLHSPQPKLRLVESQQIQWQWVDLQTFEMQSRY